MTKVVHLFPDTNVLVQCRPLEDLDWSAWREFDDVHLVISGPVQAEIDDQKNKGSDRLARRARRASTLLRHIILDAEPLSGHIYFPDDKDKIAGVTDPSFLSLTRILDALLRRGSAHAAK